MLALGVAGIELGFQQGQALELLRRQFLEHRVAARRLGVEGVAGIAPDQLGAEQSHQAGGGERPAAGPRPQHHPDGGERDAGADQPVAQGVRQVVDPGRVAVGDPQDARQDGEGAPGRARRAARARPPAPQSRGAPSMT